MKKLVVITALFSQILFAQQKNLTVQLQPVPKSAVNWETTLILEAQSGMENGLLIELPAGIKIVPVSVRLNDIDMYLQNVNEIPTNESVITWNLAEEGMVLLFSEGKFNPGDRLVLKTMMTKIKKQIEDSAQINIRTVVNSGPDIQFSEDIKISNGLSLKTEN